jgi:dihydroneopterin aldolase/2-amino-4-hydroxy-6-hydroxymethyldihydropteridine diphosphokinase
MMGTMDLVRGESGDLLDAIEITGISARGLHGVTEAERIAGQPFSADIALHLDTRAAAQADDLSLTVDYAQVAQKVASVLAGEPLNLLETLAQRIATAVLASGPVKVADVVVHKPEAPIGVVFKDVSVRIRRERRGRHALDVPEDQVPEARLESDGLALGRDEMVEAPPAQVEVASRRSASFGGDDGASNRWGVSSAAFASINQPADDAPHPQSMPISRDQPVFDRLVAESAGRGLPVVDPNVAFPASGPIPGVKHPGVPVVHQAPPGPWTPAPPANAGGAAPAPQGGIPAVPAVPAEPAHQAPPVERAVPAQPVQEPWASVNNMDQVPSIPVDAIIALGANVGDALGTLRSALDDLRATPGLSVMAVSPLARTAPVGQVEQPDFFNAVVHVRTTLSARQLFHNLGRIEDAYGRSRTQPWGPRTLDLDLIAYDGLIDADDELTVPHPSAHERAFVLLPWAAMTPGAFLPGLGGGPVEVLAQQAPDRPGVRWLAPGWDGIEEQESYEAGEPPRAWAI